MSEPVSPAHAAAEASFRRVLEDADLEQPDKVVYAFDPDAVTFLWNEVKMLVVIEIGGPGG